MNAPTAPPWGRRLRRSILDFLSRGIDEATARGMLTYGFAGEIVDYMNIEAVHAAWGAYIYEQSEVSDGNPPWPFVAPT